MIPLITKIILNPAIIDFKFTITQFFNSFDGKKHRMLTYYHDVYDPHCIAMLHVLPLLLKHFAIGIHCKLTQNSSIETFGPKSTKLFNIVDASIQAQYYAIPINLPLSDDHINDEENRQKLYDLSNSILAPYILNNKTTKFIEIALKISNILWAKNMSLNEKYIELNKQRFAQSEYLLDEQNTNKIVQDGMKSLKSNKHYLSGNIYFNGEWFPRIDRLLFLFKRLRPYKRKHIDDITKVHHEVIKFKDPFIIPSKLESETDQALNLYFSFRSPYSYLILERVYKLSQENNIKLNIRPVLPSIFRNVTINKSKTMYIPFDCSRIATYLNIPFGSIFDIGIDIKLVELCLKVFLFALSKGKEKEYTLNISKAIWAQGIDIEIQRNLDKILKESGLSLMEYSKEYEPKYLKNNEHLQMAEENVNALHDTGNWGVPSLEFKSRCCWGQDRIWALSEKYVKTFSFSEQIKS